MFTASTYIQSCCEFLQFSIFFRHHWLFRSSGVDCGRCKYSLLPHITGLAKKKKLGACLGCTFFSVKVHSYKIYFGIGNIKNSRNTRFQLRYISDYWFALSTVNIIFTATSLTLLTINITYKIPWKQFCLLKTLFFLIMSGRGCLYYRSFSYFVFFQILWNSKFLGVKSQKYWWVLYNKR